MYYFQFQISISEIKNIFGISKIKDIFEIFEMILGAGSICQGLVEQPKHKISSTRPYRTVYMCLHP